MKRIIGYLVSLGLLLSVAEVTFGQDKNMKKPDSAKSTNRTELATLGGGCFWCVEAVFERVDGVNSVTSGYTGGQKDNPTYDEICTGTTGHAEVAQLEFDPMKITFEQLLDVFWDAHDPTTLNRQGADRGTQYRSAIFYHDESQKAAAIASKERWNGSGRFSNPIVTEITPASTFYRAEEYHQRYLEKHGLVSCHIR